jgi:threonine dehydrogenase-like Zn-dependent dehydrogenase
MKTIRLHASYDLHQYEQSGLESCTGETMVHLKAVGICGSDLRWFDDTWRRRSDG